jgi:hypothetical protein
MIKVLSENETDAEFLATLRMVWARCELGDDMPTELQPLQQEVS